MSHEIESSGSKESVKVENDLLSHENRPKFAQDSELVENPESKVEISCLDPGSLNQRLELLNDQAQVQSWLKTKASPHTKRVYFRVADEFLSWLHPKGLGRATILEIQTFVEARSLIKKGTLALMSAVIKSLFSFAEKSGYLKSNLGVFISSPKTESRLTERYLSEEEFLKMITLSIDPRDQAILRLLYSGGFRISEMVGLNWADVQVRENGLAQIKVRGKGEKERVVRISDVTFNALKSIRRPGQGGVQAVFESGYGARERISDRTVRKIVLKAAMRAGIRKKVSPHWLRHAHASHALDRGAPVHLVQATLGHVSVATTGKYLHARPLESSGAFLAI